MQTSKNVDPIMEMNIGDILNGCIDVPENVKKLLAPIAGYKLKRLLNALKRIEYTPCIFEHERLAANDPDAPFINFVGACGKRPRNAGCGHQGIASLEVDRNLRGTDEEIGPLDTENINNPIAKIQFALALVLAIGNHNTEASDMIDALTKTARVATKTDSRAQGYYGDESKGRRTLEDLEEIGAHQDVVGQVVLGMRDKVLAYLKEDMEHLADPETENKRQSSGTLNWRIRSIRGLAPEDALVSAMLRE